MICFTVFSNRDYDTGIRLILVSIQISFGIVVSHIINYKIIPNYLFAGKTFRFIYFLFAIFIVSLWVMLLSSFLILLYSQLYFPFMIIPNRTDILILISGVYLVVLLAAIIHFVKESFRRVLEKNKIEKQKAITEHKLQQAQLKLLQNQIQPHFLFNMLNNLYGLSLEKSEQTPQLILKLSQLLDYMLYECDNDFVPLQKDLNFIRNYLQLEEIRHDKNMVLNYEIDDAGENQVIAPLLVFPFVENAFKHGLNNQTGKGNIDLKIKVDQETFSLELTNDNLNKETGSKDSNGLGIKNVKERLEILYPGKYQLEIDSNSDLFRVSLQLELRHDL